MRLDINACKKCATLIACLILILINIAIGKESTRKEQIISLLTNRSYEMFIQFLNYKESNKVDLTEDINSTFNVDIKFGDLFGNINEDAVALIRYNIGGTASAARAYLLLYNLDQSTPVFVSEIDGGCQSYGGIKEFHIDKGELVVDRFTPDSTGCTVCFGGVIREWYRFHNGRMQLWMSKYTHDMIYDENGILTPWIFVEVNK
jgi:hypothetical protein